MARRTQQFYAVEPNSNRFIIGRLKYRPTPDLLKISFWSPLFGNNKDPRPFSARLRAEWESGDHADMAEVRFSNPWEKTAVSEALEKYRDNLLEPYDGDLAAYWERLWFEANEEAREYYKENLREYGLNAVRLPVKA